MLIKRRDNKRQGWYMIFPNILRHIRLFQQYNNPLQSSKNMPMSWGSIIPISKIVLWDYFMFYRVILIQFYSSSPWYWREMLFLLYIFSEGSILMQGMMNMMSSSPTWFTMFACLFCFVCLFVCFCFLFVCLFVCLFFCLFFFGGGGVLVEGKQSGTNSVTLKWPGL